MQERKKYTVELTAEQFDKFQTLITLDNCTRDIVFEEVKEETTIDEREEAIKYYKCWAKCIDGCYEDCKQCEYNENMDTERVQEIALKHIQGYKDIMKWLYAQAEKQAVNDWEKGNKNAVIVTIQNMEQVFDISEADNETEID